MATNGNGYTILGLQAENVRKLKVISIHPPAVGVVKIKGRNAAGKSSTLDAIEMALSGKAAQPARPIRDGETSAVVVADLGGKFSVKRTWTANNKTYLTVERREGDTRMVVAKPAEFLESIVGAGIGFDPLAFTGKKPAEQVQTLLDVLQLPEDPREIDARRQAIYNERTLANREVKRLEGAVASAPQVPADTPEAEVPMADLAGEYEAKQAQYRDNEATRRNHQRAVDKKNAANAQVEHLRDLLIDAEAVLAEATMEETDLRAKVEALQDPDIESIRQRMATIEQTNAAVRQRAARAVLVGELKAVEGKAAGLSQRIAALDEQKAMLFQQAKLPVEGLSICDDAKGGYVVTYHGIPIQDCSSSEQLRISMALAMALSPQVRVVLVREGSLLDEEAKATLEAIAQERGYQIWLEVVSTDPEDGAFIIEDGEVVEAKA